MDRYLISEWPHRIAASRSGVLAALALVLMPGSSQGAQVLTPERVYASPDLIGARARGVQLAPDGTAVTYLKAKPSDLTVTDLWIADTRGGEPRMLIDGAALAPKNHILSEAEKSRREREGTQTHGVVDYGWDEEGRFVVVPVEGQLWLYDRRANSVRQVTDTQASDIDAKVSPKGHYVSFVRDDNVYVVPTAGGPERALTEGGTEDRSFGTAEFIAQEEFDRSTGYWWSSDDARIALCLVDQSDVDVIERPEVNANGATIVRQRYPRAGRQNAHVGLYVVDVASGARTPMDIGGNPDIYLVRVDWAKDGRTLYAQRLARDQRRLDLLAIDPKSGSAQIVLSETSPHWIEVTSDFKPLKDGRFLWSSERSGFRHLYLYSRSGVLERQLTRGDWPVDQIEGIDERQGLVYFSANKDNPTERRLYAVSWKKPSEPTAITSGGGWWTATFAKEGGVFAGTYEDPLTPPQTGLYAGDGKRIRWIEENRLAEGHPFYPYAARLRRPEYGTLSAADGQALWWLLRTPPDFDPKRRYPVIVRVYGGPFAVQVTRQWRDPVEQVFLEAGYLVFSLDNRGSANRSVAFKAALDRRLGSIEVDDQLAGVAYLKSLPFVDGARIGVTGGSYGGFMTLLLLTAPNSPFAAGVAVAPPTEWSLYDTAYTERYMGTPVQNPLGYQLADVLGRLSNLRAGTLLLMHGMADDNVTFDQSTRLMAALQARAIPFETMVYPGLRHRAGWTPENKLHRLLMTLDFFDRHLHPH